MILKTKIISSMSLKSTKTHPPIGKVLLTIPFSNSLLPLVSCSPCDLRKSSNNYRDYCPLPHLVDLPTTWSVPPTYLQ